MFAELTNIWKYETENVLSQSPASDREVWEQGIGFKEIKGSDHTKEGE